MTLFALDNDIDNFNNILSSNFALKINHDRNEHLQLGMYLFTNPAFFNIVQNVVDPTPPSKCLYEICIF